MRVLRLLSCLLLLSGCVTVHPPELPRKPGHNHAGSALHADCNACVEALGAYVRGLVQPKPKAVAPEGDTK